MEWRLNKDVLKGISKESVIKGNFPADINFTPEEADRFIDYIVDETSLSQNARIIRMTKPEKNVRSIGLDGQKVLHPAGTFSKATHKLETTNAENIQLQTKKARGVVVVNDDDLEDNIEGDAFVDHLLRMVGRAVGNELEDAYAMGVARSNTSQATTLRQLWNGWRYMALRDTHAVEGAATILDARSTDDFPGAATRYIAEQSASAPYNWLLKYHKMAKSMPSKFVRRGGGYANFRFFNNDGITMDYVEALTSRGTLMGDNAIVGRGPRQYGDTPIVNAPLYPTDIPVAVASGATGVLDAEAAAGATVISVADASGFTAGDVIMIHSNAALGTDWDAEVRTVHAVDVSDNNLTLTAALSYVQASGRTVTEVELNGTESMMTQRENLIVGIQRAIRIETERDASNEATNFWFSIRSDVKTECVAAMVMLRNLRVR